MNYLVSYNHSGNTWLRYCIEFVTKKPTHGHKTFSISQRRNNILNIDVNLEPIALKRHEFRDDEKIFKNDVFTFLLRRPDHCIKKSQDVNKEFLKYYALLKKYEETSSNKRIFMFDELFDKDKIEIIILTSVGETNSQKITELIENWEYHKKQCLSLYNNKTKEEGANLSTIPKILLDHVRKYIKF